MRERKNSSEEAAGGIDIITVIGTALKASSRDFLKIQLTHKILQVRLKNAYTKKT